MALQKQSVLVNFIKGLDLKTDPNQVPVGNYLALQNSVFTAAGRLSKRNGFGLVTTFPEGSTTVTTFNENLIATGSNLYSYNSETNTNQNQGTIQPVQLETKPLVRNSNNQTAPDIAVATNGLSCLVYLDNNIPVYEIMDTATASILVGRTLLPATATNAKVFTLNKYFVIVFIATVAGQPHLQYIAIPIAMPNSPTIATDLSTTVNSLTTGFDGYVISNNLYVAYGSTGASVQLLYLTSSLQISASVTILGHLSDLMSVTADATQSIPTIYLNYWELSTKNGFTTAYDANLNPVLAPTQMITTTSISEITSVATAGVTTVFYEVVNDYDTGGGYAMSNIRTDFIRSVSITMAGSVGTTTTILRSVGLISKAFYGPNGNTYMVVAYGPPTAPTLSNQPSYFLIDQLGNIYMRLSYSNGAGYAFNKVLSNVPEINGVFMTPYLTTDLLATTNKTTALPSGSQINSIYTQKGINLAQFGISDTNQYSSEIASALHLTGGQLWEYDGVKPVEHGFQVWPENVTSNTAGSGGNISAQNYFYVFTYEWTDNAGNLHRSAPSIPIEVIALSANSTNTLYVPTLRLTYKVGTNKVRIVGYRWSQAQQVYYQFTSLTNPTFNDTTIDYVSIVDTSSDNQILGNVILYTTGGVIENIAAPASIASAMFRNRLFLVDAEDRNLLWYSKQVIENTPVEMSDLLTIFVAPTTGAQGSTGPITALAAMDDKLIVMKAEALYYITGNGPDNTGANNDFSEPIFISSSVGCANPNSIVLMPNGLMFQSDKGIWLLGRDLSTKYIGDRVESYNSNVVKSAKVIPGTNQVRFILDNRITLMYDYYFDQWGTFNNISAISSTLYQSLHTYLNDIGQVYQETPGEYLDGSNPVLMSYTTSWMNVAGIRGYERFYFMFMLGTYFTPFKLNLQLAYDYNPNVQQSIIVTPDNNTPNWGGEALWGSGEPWGGPGNIFKARIFPQRQKCETFQITVNEIYDASLGVSPGQGLSLSGMNMVIGVKKGYGVQKASRSFG